MIYLLQSKITFNSNSAAYYSIWRLDEILWQKKVAFNFQEYIFYYGSIIIISNVYFKTRSCQ